MGDVYAEGVILDLEEMWEESDKHTPLVCFLSMGSDPTSNIESLAKKLKLECRAISMGQGQEIYARRLLQQNMNMVRVCLCVHVTGWWYLYVCCGYVCMCVRMVHVYICVCACVGRLGSSAELSPRSELLRRVVGHSH